MRALSKAIFLFASLYCCPAHGQLAATISVETSAEPDGRTRYEYVVENLPESGLPINILLLDVAPGADPLDLMQPLGWVADFAPNEVNLRLGWSAGGPSTEIPIGGSGMFSFTSPLAPGEIEYVIGNLLPDGSDFADVLFGFITGPLVPPAGIPGDYNGNGQVEQADLDLVLLNWGADGTVPPEDWVNDLPLDVIDQAELDGVLLNWGNMAALGSAAGVPEPTAWMLVLGCIVVTVATRNLCIPSRKIDPRRHAVR